MRECAADGQILSDPRFPTISARVVKLDAKFNRRMEAALSKFGPNARPVLVPTYPDSASTIRQYARAAESAVDDCAAITADFLDDVDYLAKSPDIPARERSAFAAAWPAERAGFAAKMRELLGATRDLVRLMDELADYVAFKNHPLGQIGRREGRRSGVRAGSADHVDPGTGAQRVGTAEGRCGRPGGEHYAMTPP